MKFKKLLEKIKKVDGGYVIVHCSKKNKGKRIKATKKPLTKKKVFKIHRARMK
jgi:hypothetical protein